MNLVKKKKKGIKDSLKSTKGDNHIIKRIKERKIKKKKSACTIFDVTNVCSIFGNTLTMD